MAGKTSWLKYNLFYTKRCTKMGRTILISLEPIGTSRDILYRVRGLWSTLPIFTTVNVGEHLIGRVVKESLVKLPTFVACGLLSIVSQELRLSAIHDIVIIRSIVSTLARCMYSYKVDNSSSSLKCDWSFLSSSFDNIYRFNIRLRTWCKSHIVALHVPYNVFYN